MTRRLRRARRVITGSSMWAMSPWMAAAGVTTVVVAVAACAGEAPPQSLAKTCQLKACECAAPDTSWFGRAPTIDIRWQPNGDAACPDGYVLRLSDSG